MKVMKLIPVVISAFTVVTCSSGTGLQEHRPCLADLLFTQSVISPTQAVELVGVLAPGESLSDTQFIPITLLSGEAIRAVSLTISLCTSPTGSNIVCDQILVTIHDDTSIDDLTQLLEEIDAQFVHVRPSFSLLPGGTIQVFSGDLFQAFDRVKSHPAVRLVDFNVLLMLSGSVGQEPMMPRHAIRTTSLSDAAAADRLPITSGQEVTARYVQPDGSILERIIHVQ